jgi:ubiquinol-cytochrome c reductase cytochrome c subunit
MRRYYFALTLVAATVSGAHAQSPSDGRALFVTNGCYQCHGFVGQGGAAPRIAPMVYPYEAFDRLVRRPVNEMPAYAPQTLGDDVLRAIYGYLRSIPEPPPLADITILR